MATRNRVYKSEIRIDNNQFLAIFCRTDDVDVEYKQKFSTKLKNSTTLTTCQETCLFQLDISYAKVSTMGKWLLSKTELGVIKPNIHKEIVTEIPNCSESIFSCFFTAQNVRVKASQHFEGDKTRILRCLNGGISNWK